MENSFDIYNKILKELNIEDIISEYIDIKKKGSNFIAICPFHDDKNPSLMISTSKKIYKCFTCNSGGNLIKFVMNFNKYNYKKTITILAKKIGYNIENEGDKPKTIAELNQELIYKINNDALKFFQYSLMLKNNSNIKKYLLDNRKIILDNIYKFKIGYADNTEDSLHKYLLSLGYKISDIDKAGLIKNQNGKIVDFFINRIIFSIIDINDNIIAFSGRDDNKNSKIKYLNTKSNLVFNKGKTLYNINNAKIETRKKQNLFIVEGYLDVISLNNKGIQNVVATMGTSITLDQIILLKNMTNKITLFFDGDKPGIKANIINSENLLINGFDVEIINNNTKYDPDEIATKYFILFNKILNDKLNPIDYLINKININNVDDLKLIINYFEKIKDNVIKNPLSLSIYYKKLLKYLENEIPDFNKNISKIKYIETETKEEILFRKKLNSELNLDVQIDKFENIELKSSFNKEIKHFSLDKNESEISKVFVEFLYQIFASNKSFLIIRKNAGQINIQNKDIFNLIDTCNIFYENNNNIKSIINDVEKKHIISFLERNNCYNLNIEKYIRQIYLLKEISNYDHNHLQNIINKISNIIIN